MILGAFFSMKKKRSPIILYLAWTITTKHRLFVGFAFDFPSVVQVTAFTTFLAIVAIVGRVDGPRMAIAACVFVTRSVIGPSPASPSPQIVGMTTVTPLNDE